MGSNVESKEARAERLREEEESVIDLEGKGRSWKKDMLSIQADAMGHAIRSCRLAKRRDHDRNRHATMNESDREESLGRRREHERGGDGNIRATAYSNHC